MQQKKKILTPLILILATIVLVGGVFIFRRYFSPEAKLSREVAALPSAVSSRPSAVSRQAEPKKTETITATPIPDKLNLDVPFTVQAPTGNWDRTHEEACEEAAMLMASRYFAGRTIASPADAEAGLEEIIAWETKNLGFFESTTADETARVLSQMLNLKTQIMDNPTTDNIKQALANGKLVLVPTAGQQVGNPFYKSPGPLYHMLLLKGYTQTQFITNDAGTKRGENYPYNFQTILKANHDWNGGDVASGAKKIIIVSK